MSLSDFLFQGSPPPSVTNYSSTSAQLPPWFEAYQQALLGKSNVIAGEPFQAFKAPDQSAYDALAAGRIAPFNNDTTTGWDMGRNMATEYKPTLNAAEQGVRGALQGPGSADAANPYLANAGTMSAYGAGNPYLSQAGGMSAFGAASPFLTSATGDIDAATGMPTASSAASPFLSAGTQSWPDQVQRYMNPFTEQVANRLTGLSNRNLFENVLPNVNDNFVKSGMFGASRQGDFTNRAVRDQQESLMGALSNAYSSAYNEGAKIFGADTGRQIQAGQTAGALQSSDTQNRLSAANARLSAANMAGNFTNADANRMAGLGQTAGNLMGTDATNTLQGGNLAGNFANVDRNTAGALGTNLSNIAGTDQRLGLTGASIYEGIGQQQQAQSQQLKDLMYQNFAEQRNYPKDQASFMNAMIRGLQTPQSTNSSTTAPANTYNAPPFAQILGAGTSLASLFGVNKKRGGRINAGYLTRRAA